MNINNKIIFADSDESANSFTWKNGIVISTSFIQGRMLVIPSFRNYNQLFHTNKRIQRNGEYQGYVRYGSPSCYCAGAISAKFIVDNNSFILESCIGIIRLTRSLRDHEEALDGSGIVQYRFGKSGKRNFVGRVFKSSDFEE